MNKDYFTYIDIKGELFDETEKFLKTLAPRRTEIMVDAIKQAENGNVKTLNMIRKFRSAPCEKLADVETREMEIDSCGYKIPVCIYSKKGCMNQEQPLFVYVHGGGWTIGDINTCADFCQYLAASGITKVMSFDYRLAPEFKSPTALDDCEAVYKYALQNAKSIGADLKNIYLGGDSAGGHLAIALADRLVSAQINLPHALILFYPVTTFENRDNDESYRMFGENFALDSKLMDAFNDAYLPDVSARKSASPLNFTTLNKFPPTLIISSGHDILRDQDKEFADRLARENQKTRHICLRGATHIYVTMAGMPKCFAFALNETKEFIENTRM